MKKAILLITAVIVPLFFCMETAYPKEKIDEEEITLIKKDTSTLKNKGNNKRKGLILAIGEIHSDKRGLIGILIKMQHANRTPAITIELFNKNENYKGGDLNCSTTNVNYVGKILPSGLLKPKGSMLKTTKISAKDAKTYVDAMKVIDEIK